MKVWDRRSKQVRDDEIDLWKDISPLMMSDEETTEDSQAFKRRRPDWRSDEFNDLMDELDQRSYSKASKHPRKARVIGSPLRCPWPENIKEWMLKPQEDQDEQDCN